MTPERRAELRKDDLAKALHAAWQKYTALFGEPPHGTEKQLRTLSELIHFDALEAAEKRERALLTGLIKIAYELARTDITDIYECDQLENIRQVVEEAVKKPTYKAELEHERIYREGLEARYNELQAVFSEAQKRERTLRELLTKLSEDCDLLEGAYPGLWKTGAGYVLHPRIVEIRAALKEPA